jgi:hypothetical protein
MKRLPDPTFDQRLADWLEDDPNHAPSAVLDTVVAAFPSIEQRRRSRLPWRYPLMNRSLIPLTAAVILVAGALFIALRPASQIGPAPSPSPTIEGTWDVAFSRQEMIAAGLLDEQEDNDGNYGHFHLTFQSGWWTLSQLAPFGRPGGTATYTLDPGVAHLFSPADNATFDLPYTVTATTLTFGPGGPVTFRVKPWTRVATERITATPFPADIAAYRQARNVVYDDLFRVSMPPDADPVKNPSGAITLLQAVISRANDEMTRLSALTVPASIQAEHLANIQLIRDTLPLLQQEIDLINQGKADQVDAVDQQTAPLSAQFEQYEQKYGFAGCP